MLATLNEVKTQLWITWTDQDTLITQLLWQADGFIKKYTQRVLEAISLTEYYNWEWQNILLLKEYPVNTLTSFQKNTWTFGNPVYENFDIDSYTLLWEAWEIYLKCWLIKWVQNIKVVYNAWFTTIPKDLNWACIQLVWYYLNTKNSQWVSSESVDGASISYNNAPTIPSEIIQTLELYKKNSYV